MKKIRKLTLAAGNTGGTEGASLTPKESVLALKLCEAVSAYVAADGSMVEKPMIEACEAMEKALEEHDIQVEGEDGSAGAPPGPLPDCIGCNLLSMMLGELSEELGIPGENHPAMVAEIRRLKGEIKK